MTRAIMHGCNGRMGQMITQLVKEDPEITIVAGIDQHREQQQEYPVYGTLKECKEEADVIIDFSNSSALDELLDYCISEKMPVVLCTTGLSEEQKELVKVASKVTAVMKSANMSLGINVLLKTLKEMTKVLAPKGFDIEIVEKHHNQKVDAPSGTALALADAMNEAMSDQYEYTYDRSQVRRKREENEIGISAVRGGTIVGEHEIIFAGTDEVITVKHTAYSRAIFGKGAIEAAKFLKGKQPGLYDMQDVI